MDVELILLQANQIVWAGLNVVTDRRVTVVIHREVELVYVKCLLQRTVQVSVPLRI